MKKENYDSKDVKTPSSVLTEEQISDIKCRAEEWKNAKSKSDKFNITKKFKDCYKNNEEANDFFKRCKNGVVIKKNFKRRIPHSDEAIARQYFADVLKECIQESFYKNENIDVNDGIFLLDENCNLPPYFWTRLNTNVLPKLSKVGCNEHRAWRLGAGIIKKHRDELNSRLKNTNFVDLKHVCHTVIQFLDKYMLVTYKELVEKNKKMLLEKKRSEEEYQKILQEKDLLQDVKTQKIDEMGVKIVRDNVGFDISDLL